MAFVVVRCPWSAVRGFADASRDQPALPAGGVSPAATDHGHINLAYRRGGGEATLTVLAARPRCGRASPGNRGWGLGLLGFRVGPSAFPGPPGFRVQLPTTH